MPSAAHASLVVFVLVYAAMVAGRVPALRLDRTGAALLGALVLVACGAIGADAAWSAVDVPTIALLFAMMVLSAQLAQAGAYARLAQHLDAARAGPKALLALVVMAGGLLSAVLTNDVVCLALAPLVVDVARRRSLHPLPFLLALAAAANAGSALTLIGNPQNILVGQTLKLDFAAYSRTALVPVVAALVMVWTVVWLSWRGRIRAAGPREEHALETACDRWQTLKGVLLLATTMGLFLATTLPREAVALGAAAIVLCSRRTASRAFLARVDWPLLVLFVGLFVVHAAFELGGWTVRMADTLRAARIDLGELDTVYWLSVPLSNVVSNVPATMLLLGAGVGAELGPALALASTLAGNLLLVGSIANLIVAEEAQRRGLDYSWKEHARIGLPIGAVSLALAWIWLRFLAV